MRELTDHKYNAANERIDVLVMDEPGHGGACHEYAIHINKDGKNLLRFQNGPIKEKGVNGITHEVLLAILIDRLQGYQAGDYKCRENAIALTKMEEALMWLHKRTKDREARGVEGTYEI